MRLRAHHVLFAGFAGIIALLVVVVALVAQTGLRRELVDLYRAELERQLALAEEALRTAGSRDYDALARAITRRIGFRVTIIAPDGRVLGDSDLPAERLSELENQAGQTDFQTALLGGTGFAESEGGPVGYPALYAAHAMAVNGTAIVLRIAAPLEEIDATVGRAQRAVLAAGVLTLLLALAVSYVLSRMMMRPVGRLGERARSLAAGDFSQRAPMDVEVSELDDLAIAFNRLAEELEARLGELSHERDEMQALIDCMAEGVVALTADGRVARVNRAAAQILRLPADPAGLPVGALVRQPELRAMLEAAPQAGSEAREITFEGRALLVAARPLDTGGAVITLLDTTELRRLERVRRDFVANASHELKTPLTSMRGYAETLLEGEPPSELRRQFLESIHSNAVRLQHLVDDLLELSRLESGAWRPAFVEVEVAQVAREVWLNVEPRAREKGVRFSVPGPAPALADLAALEQILSNLFDNALRHTPAGGEIRVATTRRGETIEVQVSDTGSGIPSAALPRIFERFYRVDPSRSRAEGGTGLGLSIVRHLVETMGGTVSAESELGRGTTIRFTLPAARLAPVLDNLEEV
ncbi:MAG: HAMP domain-containing protein [Gemmatimonadetes bacterium]|nr:HAMP domain-containing protein [Gemmatimonadota bacterium]